MKKALMQGIFLVGAILFILGTPEASHAQTKFQFKLDSPLPSTHWYQNVAKHFIKEIETRTNGMVKIRLFTGGALGSWKETVPRLEKGLEEIGIMVAGYTPGRFDLSTIVELPFAFPDIGTAYDVGNELIETSPDLQNEFKTVRFLFAHYGGMHDIASAGKAIRKMEDFEGVKIRCPGGAITKAMEVLGAKPITMPASEIYTALQRKVVDANIVPAASIPGYKLEEVLDYYTVLGMTVASVHYIINPKTWDSLPDHFKTIFQDVSKRCSQLCAYTYLAEFDKGIEVMKKAGVEIIEIPPDEIARLRKKVRPVWDDWVQRMEAKGLPGKKVMEHFKGLLAKRGVIID